MSQVSAAHEIQLVTRRCWTRPTVECHIVRRDTSRGVEVRSDVGRAQANVTLLRAIDQKDHVAVRHKVLCAHFADIAAKHTVFASEKSLCT